MDPSIDPSSAKGIANLQHGQGEVESLKDRKESVPLEFEKIFARHLVEEMTKGMFEADEEQPMMQSQSMYKDHITDTLADHLADQRELGIADMVEHFWDDRLESDDEGNTKL